MIRFFISVALPSIAAMTVVAVSLQLWAGRRIRACQAERRAIQAQRSAIEKAHDALATVISDNLASASTREQAIPAYEALGWLLKRREIS